MSEVNTRWTHATTDPNVAMTGLISCLESGLNAWIELRDNGDQEFPIMMVNPALDNPFNWAMSYGTIRNPDEMAQHRYLNEMEKELTYNWTSGFGDPEAVKKYKETGEITEGLLSGVGEAFPIRVKDAEEYREKITGDNYKYRFWVTYWKPKKGIKPYVVDNRVGKVFTICSREEPVNKAEALRRAAEFMIAYADRLNV